MTILVAMDSKAVTCQSCIVQGTANIAYTLFFININLIAQLFDQFNNPLQQIAAIELFKMCMRRNNMNPLDLLVQKTVNQTNGLLIDVD